ncbi:MAG: ECF-type sigma factor [Bryobacteraceae bacterium]
MKPGLIPNPIDSRAGALYAPEMVPESISVSLPHVHDEDHKALGQLVPVVYRELRRRAAKYLSRETPGHTLQPTALINETFVRLAEGAGIEYKSHTHFVAVAARAMREILVDHARKRRAFKRGGVKVTLDERMEAGVGYEAQVIALNDALDLLAAVGERKARMVEMRFFGGMTAEEIAVYFDTPAYTVRRELRAAMAWLRREMAA